MGVLLRQALRDFCDSLAGSLEPETLGKYRRDAETIAEAIGPSKPLQGVTRADIRNWASTSNLSKKRLDNLLTPLRGTFKQAVEDGILQANPLEGFQIRRVRETKDRIDPFTTEEIGKLCKAPLGELWQFWAWTGLRTGEVIGLRWDDVGHGLTSISVRRSVRVGREKRTKTRSGERSLVLLPAARAALSKVDASRLADDGGREAIFRNPNTGERWHEDRGLARAFRKACRAAGVRYRYPYQLRHTFASWGLSSGENPLWVAQQMGHADVTMIFKVYGRYVPSMNPQAGRKMARFKAG